jgi:Meiotically Up-regulated Gene 113 (MUG113) protein/AAA domain-containing protein
VRQEDRVYFIFAAYAGLIKIGIAYDVEARLKALQSNTGDRLHLLLAIPGGRAKEAELHQRFSADRVRGEWFRPSPALLSLVREYGDTEVLPAIHAPACRALFSPGVYFLLGHKFAGKTYLSLQIACDLAKGCASLAGIDRPTGGALVINVEDGAGSVRARLERIPSGPPGPNVQFAFDFPTLTTNFKGRAEEGFAVLEQAIHALPERQLFVLDSWFGLAGCWGRNSGTVEALRRLAEGLGVSFLILHTPEFDNFHRGGLSTLGIIAVADATLLLRRSFAQRRGDLIVASPDLTAVSYSVVQNNKTGFWAQEDGKPRPLSLNSRWWELREP